MAHPVLSTVSGKSNSKDYAANLTWYVLFTCVVGAMGGLIFGYDIGISGGVTSMPSFLHQFFPSVYRKQLLDTSANQYCTFNNATLTMFTSSLYLAALVSSLFASLVTKMLGRKFSMFLGGLIFLAGAALNGFAHATWHLIVGRLLLGLGIGFSVQSVPLYLSEMAPYKWRGFLNILFQLLITVGILWANTINYFMPKLHGSQGWRYSLGIAMAPALVIVISAGFLPNTPNSILEKATKEEDKEKAKQEARRVLRRIRGASDAEIEAEFQDIVAASEQAKEMEHPWRNINNNNNKRKYRPHLVMAILIPALQQLTGINVVMFYAPVLFKSLGFGDSASLLSAVITGAVNFVATLVSMWVTDKHGRRVLFLEGGLQMFIFQGLLAGFIGYKFGLSGVVSDLPVGYAVLIVVFICFFVAGFAWSWGPLGWLVPSEIFPLEIRSAAQSIVSAVNMLFTFLIAQLFLFLLCKLKFGLFILFAFFVAIMTAFIYWFLPETKNIPIEEMSQIWINHWYWKRFVVLEDH
ncbi:sugar carrier protein C-like, partial [Euphorbia lathyris]|uniref:sugar carrier protein C-like n=1 Tax=Euphorbia lathyris TaxID=212925 RepID=UPI003313CCF9